MTSPWRRADDVPLGKDPRVKRRVRSEEIRLCSQWYLFRYFPTCSYISSMRWNVPQGGFKLHSHHFVREPCSTLSSCLMRVDWLCKNPFSGRAVWLLKLERSNCTRAEGVFLLNTFKALSFNVKPLLCLNVQYNCFFITSYYFCYFYV